MRVAHSISRPARAWRKWTDARSRPHIISSRLVSLLPPVAQLSCARAACVATTELHGKKGLALRESEGESTTTTLTSEQGATAQETNVVRARVRVRVRLAWKKAATRTSRAMHGYGSNPFSPLYLRSGQGKSAGTCVCASLRSAMDVYGRGPGPGPGPGQISEVSRARAPGSSNEFSPSLSATSQPGPGPPALDRCSNGDVDDSRWGLGGPPRRAQPHIHGPGGYVSRLCWRAAILYHNMSLAIRFGSSRCSLAHLSRCRCSHIHSRRAWLAASASLARLVRFIFHHLSLFSPLGGSGLLAREAPTCPWEPDMPDPRISPLRAWMRVRVSKSHRLMQSGHSMKRPKTGKHMHRQRELRENGGPAEPHFSLGKTFVCLFLL